MTYAVDVPVDRSDVVAATVSVLQQEGYAIALANENVGVVTTEWQDTTSGLLKFAGAFSGTAAGERKQISASVSVDGKQIVLQLTKQNLTTLGGWNNARPSTKDKEEVDRLLAVITAYVSRRDE
ncbi:MAG: hypothetical protein Q8P01_01990 [bacterium]|nr:hypothetical protein [bacterium]MDP2703971.1 hypothetical protein [bacterium]